MRTTNYKLFTLKNNLYINKPNFLHLFMIKSGLIRKLSSGIYIWLPNGVRIINNIKKLLTAEMNKIGAMELNLPLLQPVSIWYKSHRFYTYGPELIKLLDRHNKIFILSPTHEEVIASVIETEKYLYNKDLPIILYQITTKFRDEKRPKFGIMRCKEFLMKDAYSLHITKTSLKNTYELIMNSYKHCFKQMNLNFYVVKANNGSMGGTLSHEFHVITNIGEDKIAISDNLHYIANLEVAKKQNLIFKPNLNKTYWLKNNKTFLENILVSENTLQKHINTDTTLETKVLQTIFIKISNKDISLFYAVIKKQTQTINFNKILLHLNYQHYNIQQANNKEILEVLKINCNNKFYGPLGLKIPIIIDENIVNFNNFIVGANINNKYFINVNWGRDISLSNKHIGDLCNVEQGDFYIKDKSKLTIKHSMEIAHIFKLGNKYFNKNKSLYMGCYGIGINRLILAIIEQNINYNNQSIIWPITISPFKILILPINMYNSKLVAFYANKFYIDLLNNNIDVLFDDRKVNPGVMFHDMELIGIPYIIILSENNLQNDNVEYQNRQNNLKTFLSTKTTIDFILNQIKSNYCLNNKYFGGIHCKEK